MRVLICGGRNFKDWGAVAAVLNPMHPQISLVIHGGATGADSLASEWAFKNGVPELAYPVKKEDWDRHGKAAGPIRNAKMLMGARPQIVIAFPGGPWTKDMCAQARKAGVPVLQVMP